MKNIFKIILVGLILSACEDEPKPLVKMRDFERNRYEALKKELVANNKKYLKRSIDSIARKMSEKPSVKSKGFFISKDVDNLPEGVIIKFKPESLDDIKAHTAPGSVYNGPYMCIVQGKDGKQTISNISYKNWMILDVGYEIKK